MIAVEKQASALLALHRVIVLARSMAFLNEPGVDVGDVLDEAEYLVVMIMKPEDSTSDFRSILESMAQKREQFQLALRLFDESST